MKGIHFNGAEIRRSEKCLCVSRLDDSRISRRGIKTIIGIVAVLLTFVGYVPYIIDIVKGKTKPHLYSWILWVFVTSIAFGLQITNNGGMGSFVTLAAVIMCGGVIVLSLKGEKIKASRVDKLFVFLAVVSLVFWLIAKKPIVSILLVTLVDVLAFAPTVRKSWNLPHSETLFLYVSETFRLGFAILALNEYNLITLFYPTVWLIANGMFAVTLIIRRRTIAEIPLGSD